MRPAMWKPVKITAIPPRKRCRSSIHAAEGSFGWRVSFPENARPQMTDAVTSAHATIPDDRAMYQGRFGLTWTVTEAITPRPPRGPLGGARPDRWTRVLVHRQARRVLECRDGRAGGARRPR